MSDDPHGSVGRGAFQKHVRVFSKKGFGLGKNSLTKNFCLGGSPPKKVPGGTIHFTRFFLTVALTSGVFVLISQSQSESDLSLI